MTICLAGEPESLYRYARAEPGREHILAALEDGPIDAHDYAFDPVLLEALPSIANGGVQVEAVLASPGDTVADALGRVLPLEAGLELMRPDGSAYVYDGAAPAELAQMRVTFHLRAGLRWSDGAPLTADDSVFAFEIAGSPDSIDPLRPVAERTRSYQALDATTTVWTGLPGYLDPLPEAVTHFWPPLPSHRYAGLTAQEIADSQEARRAPVGWGPFVVGEWGAGRLVLERNPLYWRAGEGLPRLDRVVYRFVEDPPALGAALRAGECDLAPSSAALAAIASELRAAEAAATVKLYSVPGTTLEHLEFDLQPAGGPATPASAALQDVRVRQALAFCLDRQALSPEPAFEPPSSYVPSGHPLHAQDVQTYVFDPSRGRALLAEAGWLDTDGDGLLDEDGAALALTLAGGTALEPLLSAIQAQLRANCGVEAKPHLLTRGELEGDWPEGVIFGRHYDLAVFGWRIGPVPPCAAYTSGEIAGEDNPGGANAAGYSNPAYDDACRRALGTLDSSAAAQAQAEAQRVLARDLPMLPLFFEPRWGAARPEVEGYTLDASSESELWNIETMDVKGT